jgi:uncharacterized protein (DUF2062 family)
MKLHRLSKYYYLKFIRLKGDPHSLALGSAIGVFVGLTPTMPLHTAAILVLTLLTRSSMIAAITISWLICNPLTYIPIYAFSVKIGNALTPYTLNWAKIKEVLNFLLSHPGLGPSLRAVTDLGGEAIVVLLVGGCVLALPFTLISYYASLLLFIKIRKKRREKHILK